MRSSGIALIVYALLVSVLSATSARPTLFVVLAGACAVAVAGGVQLVAGRKHGLKLAFIGIGVLLAVGLVFLGLRVAFAVENGGLEGPGGLGSPLAFAIGLAFEQGVFTLPASGLMWFLWRTHRAAAAG
jgi:hypothetical protein